MNKAALGHLYVLPEVHLYSEGAPPDQLIWQRHTQDSQNFHFPHYQMLQPVGEEGKSMFFKVEKKVIKENKRQKSSLSLHVLAERL